MIKRVGFLLLMWMNLALGLLPCGYISSHAPERGNWDKETLNSRTLCLPYFYLYDEPEGFGDAH